MTLHVLQWQRHLEDCLSAMGSDDDILLIGEAVHLLATDLGQPLNAVGHRLMVLEEDLNLSGLTQSGLNHGQVRSVGYDDWVALSISHKTQVTW